MDKTILRKQFSMETTDLKLKMLGEGTGSFSGYGAVYGVVDRDNEILANGVFASSLPAFRLNGFIADSHEWEEPVATISEAYEDPYGLYISAQFHSDDDSQAIRTRTVERLERGQNVGLSVGFRVLESESNAEGLTVITKGELFEVSIVTVPANPMALVMGAKQFREQGLPETEREFEQALRKMGFSRSDAVAITNHGYKSILAQRDSGPVDQNDLATEELRFLLNEAFRLGIQFGDK